MKKFFKSILKAALVAAFWLTVWELLSLAVGKEVLLPSPFAAARHLASLACTKAYWLSCASTLLRICSGLLIGAAAGMLIAIACHCSRILRALAAPLLSIIRATPVASFIILALVWIGRGRVPAFTSFLMVVPVMCGGMAVAFQSIDNKLCEVAQVFRLPFAKKVFSLYIPSVLPAFAGSFRTSMGLAWKAGVAAEVLCTPSGSIGSSLYDSKVYLETADLFAWTASVIILSMILEHMFDALTRYLQKKFSPSAEVENVGA